MQLFSRLEKKRLQFQHAAALAEIPLREVSSFTGFDYTKGRMIRLALLYCDNHRTVVEPM